MTTMVADSAHLATRHLRAVAPAVLRGRHARAAGDLAAPVRPALPVPRLAGVPGIARHRPARPPGGHDRGAAPRHPRPQPARRRALPRRRAERAGVPGGHRAARGRVRVVLERPGAPPAPAGVGGRGGRLPRPAAVVPVLDVHAGQSPAGVDPRCRAVQPGELGGRGRPRDAARAGRPGLVLTRTGALLALAVVCGWLATRAFRAYQRFV